MLRYSRLALVALSLLALTLATAFAAAPSLEAAGPTGRFIAIAKSAGDFDALRNDAKAGGGRILRELPGPGVLVVSGSPAAKSKLNASTHSAGVANDHITRLIKPTAQVEMFNRNLARRKIPIDLRKFPQQRFDPDPAFSYPGLMWNILRINAPQAWKETTGLPAVQVGVADTGLDYTHVELASRVNKVVDFTLTEDPPICKEFFGLSDQELAAQTGGPANGDFNGHGSWIGGNIAAAANNTGINGIAPNIKLVALKIAQWCGYAWDSTILDAFQYAADNHIDVVSISFGGYFDRSDPEQDVIYRAYRDMVSYAMRKGTAIVAAAGNEHLRIGAGGLVLSHGPQTIPGDPFDDLFGWWETPGGIPGVVNVSATGNVVNPSSNSCAPGTTGSATDFNATCKPKSDAHQAPGAGKQNQLTYYSNYGPRIDVAAPGGARKFNLPNYDRGGTPGFPYTSEALTNVWEEFSITSNYAIEIPCFVFTGGGFPANQCYTSIQGTSMATPHVSAVLALIYSKRPALRGHPEAAIRLMLAGAQDIHGNLTQPLSATDKSPGDLTGVPCTTGYCHLGGPAISDREAYGAGLVNAQSAGRFGY